VPVFYAYPSEKKARQAANPAKQDGIPDGYRQKPDSGSPSAFVYDLPAGTIPIYSQHAGDRYFFSLTGGGDPKTWGQGNIMFHAYKDKTWGTVPIWIHEVKDPSKGGDRYFLDLGGRSDYETYGWQNGSILFHALPLGYRIGDQAANIKGHDQQNAEVELNSLKDGTSWIWIEVCAAWCGPCQMMARKSQEFVDSVNSQGLALKLFSVLADDRAGGPSTQQTAQWWVTNITQNTHSVVHCAGDPTSQLYQLVFRYALANGADGAAVPTSMLVDPSGELVYYQVGSMLSDLQKNLAIYSKHTLTGTWVP
jgi:thiol-disulfide isomerase/thioredoxin